MNEKSVLLVGNFLSAHGRGRGVCEDLAERLPALGWRVLTTSRVLSRWSRPADMLLAALRWRDGYVVAHVDVYSGPAFAWAEAVAWLLRALGKPYGLTLHGGNLPAFAARWPRRVRSLLSSAAFVTAPSAYLREELTGMRPDILEIPNALDTETYPFRLRTRPEPRLVWLRAFHRLYDPEMVPRLVARLLPEWPSLSVAMVGPDSGDGSGVRTRALAERLGVAGQINFVGPVPKSRVPAILAGADIFINTTTVDNTPVSVLEAMACGLCVVSTRAGGLPNLLRDGFDALTAAPGDADGLAAAVGRILRDPALAEHLSRHAREKAVALDWKRVLPLWDGLLSSSRAAGSAFHPSASKA